MDSIETIQEQIDSIKTTFFNQTSDIYINAIHNEFIILNNKINIPKISVKELDYKNSIPIIKNIIQYIPEFLYGHTILRKRKPASEQHSLHFIKKFSGKLLNFTHIFKIDLKFSGDPTNIIEKGNTEFYPSFITDRIYYKSRLIPENVVGSPTSDFTPIRLKSFETVESDQYFHTFAIFDELNTIDISKEFNEKFDSEIFSISPTVYPFIVYDYFTSCFNVTYPTNNEIKKAIEIFEPIFIYLYKQYKNINDLSSLDKLVEIFNKELIISNDSLTLNPDFLIQLKNYFSQFNLFRNDELLLKGWQKIIRK